jgi:hypothetical protein
MPFRLPLVVLHSPLTPGTCRDRLQRVTEPDRGIYENFVYWVVPRTRKPLRGAVVGESFRVRQPNLGPKSLGGSYFWGKLIPENGGTRIEGYFASAPGLLRIYFSILTIFAPALFLGSYWAKNGISISEFKLPWAADQWTLVLLLCFFFSSPSILNWGWQKGARVMERYIVGWLERVLSVQRLDAASQGKKVLQANIGRK